MLRRLRLQHFRNYTDQELCFSPGVNALLGRNGQGKTNVLEAIYYLALLRSFRTPNLDYLTEYGSGSFSIFGEVQDSNGTVRLGVSNGAERKLVVEGTPVHRASEFISRFMCAAFIPEDLTMVKGTPQSRRRFMNISLCQLSQEYLAALQEYNEALKNCNAMLKLASSYPKASITAWDEVLAARAAAIETARREMADEINASLEELSRTFFPDGRKLSVNFLSGSFQLLEKSRPESREEFRTRYLDALSKNYERDCREGTTRLGPHRSDLPCLLDGRMLANFGSEGECRTAAITVKLAVLEIMRRMRGGNDITMLVDDVIGELDSVRRKAFLDTLASSGQVIFAGTSLPDALPEDTAVFHVHAGKITAGERDASQTPLKIEKLNAPFLNL